MLVTFNPTADWDWLTDAEMRRAAFREARQAAAERRQRDCDRLATLRVVARGSTGTRGGEGEDEDGRAER